MTPEDSLAKGARVRHPKWAAGTVVADNGETVVVRFDDHGLQEVEKAELSVDSPLTDAVRDPEWHAPVDVVTRAQAEAILSVNDRWGVFSRVRIALLPHQLWVCKRVLETWPSARWLVADDVGLGKTIEAGLILTPLLSRQRVKRLLVLCPASLVDQWTQRLRTQFDIRLARYATEVDTPAADFWNTHGQVVASFHTLREDRNGRFDRLFASEPWDLLLVDEAHHLNADEKGGPTLAYKLVETLAKRSHVQSMVFFTGTPHRGKEHGFLSLLELLQPEVFSTERPLREQLPRLRDVMIRNNKQNVTNLRGQRLFQAPDVKGEEYGFSPPEARFYDMLTDFIASGKAYAGTLASKERRAVMLVLVSMQKLASSSTAAVRRALSGRLARVSKRRREVAELKELRKKLDEYDLGERDGDDDRLSALDEQIVVLAEELKLMENEEPELKKLVAAADAVTDETKIGRILRIIDERFAGRSVLFFTEYKATQALLMSALIREHGPSCVTFINGDERIEGVVDASGKSAPLVEPRAAAAARFNEGKVRFLVSTEAGGEGIDLQESCHTLIHVDLPWNPMRLHQRVGRLNRYGQTERVDVVHLRNPATVEARVWDILFSKLDGITEALGHVMDEPEDLRQLVLGMTSPSVFRDLFARAPEIARDGLSSWFEAETASFGGRELIETVRDLVGHCAKFDFQQAAAEIPDVDLPDLQPFFLAMLARDGRRPRLDSGALSFNTPETWRAGEPAILSTYESMIFDRKDRSKDAWKRMLGVGHRLMDKAIDRARTGTSSLATLPSSILARPLLVVRVRDRLTGEATTVRSLVFGVDWDGSAAPPVLRDGELLRHLNAISGRRAARARSSAPPPDVDTVSAAIEGARRRVEAELPRLSTPFRRPESQVLSVLWPVAAAVPDGEAEEGETDGTEIAPSSGVVT